MLIFLFILGLDFLVLNHVYGYKPGFWNGSKYHFEDAQKLDLF